LRALGLIDVYHRLPRWVQTGRHGTERKAAEGHSALQVRLPSQLVRGTVHVDRRTQDRPLSPIDTRARAYAALAYSAQKGTAGSYATVERAVNKRYPDIETKHHKPKGK
jgi:hypothetical protein